MAPADAALLRSMLSREASRMREESASQSSGARSFATAKTMVSTKTTATEDPRAIPFGHVAIHYPPEGQEALPGLPAKGDSFPSWEEAKAAVQTWHDENYLDWKVCVLNSMTCAFYLL